MTAPPRAPRFPSRLATAAAAAAAESCALRLGALGCRLPGAAPGCCGFGTAAATAAAAAPACRLTSAPRAPPGLPPDAAALRAPRPPSRRPGKPRFCPAGTSQRGGGGPALRAPLPVPDNCGRRRGTRRFATMYTREARRSRLLTFLQYLIGTTAVGFLAATAMWYLITPELRKYPKSVQRKLRQGFRARDVYDDLTGAVEAFESALEELLADPSPPPELTPDSPHVIGVMDQLAHTLALKGLLHDAADVYRRAFSLLADPAELEPNADLGPAPPGTKLSRALGIAQRLGELCQQTGDADGAERYLTWSVRRLFGDPEVLRLNEMAAARQGPDAREFAHPSWTTPADAGACVEALGTFYARARGRYDLAVPMFLRALSFVDTKADPCRAAVLLNNVAEAMVGLARFEDAGAWVAKGLEMAGRREDGECAHARAALLFNAGMIRELTEDHAGAKLWYKKARTFADERDIPDAVVLADDALRRLSAA